MANDQDIIRRIRVAGGLRDLAAFIETNLDLPVPHRVEISYAVIEVSDKAAREEVDRIGRILGEIPSTEYEEHHYAVSRRFGPVTFTATAITRDYIAHHIAKWQEAQRYGRRKWSYL